MSNSKNMKSILFPNTDQPYQVTDSRIPTDPGAYKYMATDGSGNWVAEDRLAYVKHEDAQVVVDTESILEPEYDEAMDANVAYINFTLPNFEPGAVYIVTLNGEEYEVVAIDAGILTVAGYEIESGLDYILAPNTSTATLNRIVRAERNVVKLLPEQFIPSTTPNIQSATVGQTVVVKAVDENGKPIEWEAKDATPPFIIIFDGSGGDDTYIESNMSYDMLKANYDYLGLRDAVLYYRNADLGYHCTSFEYTYNYLPSEKSYFTITFENAGITVTYDEENNVTISVTGEGEA